MISESDISRAIEQTLKRAGYYPIRIQSGSGRVRGGWMRNAPAGTPDLFVDPLGWLEVKTPSGRLSAAQTAWHEAARARGSRVAVVRSVAEAMHVVNSWRESDHGLV